MLSKDAFQWVDRYIAPLAEGMLFTLYSFVGALVVATIVGLAVGGARLSSQRVIRYPAIGFVEVFRGTAALVQLFWIFYALPLVLGITFPPLFAAWIVIGFNQGAYLAEVVRSGIQAVPIGQIEASIAINLRPATRWRRIVLPQALPILLPPYTNHAVTILKETAIVSLIGITDLTFTANQLRTQFGHTTALFAGIAAVYLIAALLLARCGREAERAVDPQRTSRRRFSRRRGLRVGTSGPWNQGGGG